MKYLAVIQFMTDGEDTPLPAITQSCPSLQEAEVWLVKQMLSLDLQVSAYSAFIAEIKFYVYS